MAGKKNSEKELGWRKLVDRQAGSGLSIREFCAHAGVSQPSFYAWRKRFREQDGAGRRGRRPSGSEQAKGSSDFIPLRLRDAASELVVLHPLGYQVRVTGEVNLTALRQVLEVLDGRRDG